MGIVSDARSREMTAHRQHRVPFQRCGATFVDLVIAALIIGILAAAGVPKMSDALLRSRERQEPHSEFRPTSGGARQRAMSQSTTQVVRFPPGDPSYTLVGVTDLEHSGQPYTVILGESPYQAELVSVDAGGDDEFAFDRFGQPDSAVTVVVASGAFQKTVTVDSETGLVSIP